MFGWRQRFVQLSPEAIWKLPQVEIGEAAQQPCLAIIDMHLCSSYMYCSVMTSALSSLLPLVSQSSMSSVGLSWLCSTARIELVCFTYSKLCAIRNYACVQTMGGAYLEAMGNVNTGCYLSGV